MHDRLAVHILWVDFARAARSASASIDVMSGRAEITRDGRVSGKVELTCRI
jgi:hypothetical protein